MRSRSTEIADSMSEPATVLEMRGIRKAFPAVVALDGVDLTLLPGEVHMLLGENGAGKSTLVRILSGAARRDAGEIRLRDRLVSLSSPRDAIACGIRVIYQELSLVPQLSVAENMFLGSLPTRAWGVVDWRTLFARASGVLRDLGLDVDPRSRVAALGLAQRQLVEIAKALADPGTSILVMDEPSSSLTSREVDQLFAIVARLIARGVSVVYITHRLDEVFRIGDRITVLRDGRRVAADPIDRLSVSDLVRLMSNREVSEPFPKVRAPRGPELLRVERLGRSGVLDDVSFALRAGEVLGVAGLVGAGRTELARILAGADAFDTGRMFVDGAPVRFRGPADAIAHGIGLLPEDRQAQGLVPALTVVRNIALPHGRQLSRMGVLPRGCEEALAAPVVNDLRVRAGATTSVRLLSGGNQQKVVLGKWLAGHARIFIFDEPTRGIDVGSKAEIYSLMNRLTARGAGIVMISSELPELLGMSDRILVMHRGRVQATFDEGSASEARVLSAAFGIGDAGAAH
jgi:ribose transport system ATP-binding protein